MTVGSFTERYPWLGPYAERRGLSALIDHTLLKPEATEAEIRLLCEQAGTSGFGAVCVNGEWVTMAAKILDGSGVRVAATVGFPLGACGLAAKVSQARLATLDGADELDMVAALGAIRGGEWSQVEDEIAAVVSVVGGRLVKAILETALLTEAEIEQAARTAVRAGARMVKSSTGFHPAGGASVDHIRLLRAVAGPGIGVKASGGIRTAETARAMLAAGADRLGTSSAMSWSDAVGGTAPRIRELLP